MVYKTASFQFEKHLLLTMLILSGIVMQAQDFSFIKDKTIPDFKVGAETCPDTIAKIEAPFTMPQLNKTIFNNVEVCPCLVPSNDANVCRLIIQNAIDELSEKGGGKVVIPQGHWLTGRIELKSDINLEIPEGATLEFSGFIKDYLPVVPTRNEGVDVYSLGACIYSLNAHHIAITGKGHILGASTDCEMYGRSGKDLETIVTYGKTVDMNHLMPMDRRIFDGSMEHFNGWIYLPSTICAYHCSDVLIEGVTLDKGIFWNIVPQYCDSVIIRGITVNSFGHGRTDGIDVDSSHDVLIEYCTLDCQDDCFTMKSGRGLDALRVGRSTENVVIRNCMALRGAGGLVCGTETGGGIRNIYCYDCEFRGTDQGIRLKTRRPRFGTCQAIYLDNIRAINIKNSMLRVDMLGSEKFVGDLAKRFPAREKTVNTPVYKNINISNLFVDGCEYFIKSQALPESPLSNVKITNSIVKCEKNGFIVDASDITIDNVNLYTDDLELITDNVLNLTVKK